MYKNKKIARYYKKKIFLYVFSFLIFAGLNFAKAEELDLNLQPSLNLKPLEIFGNAGIKSINIQDIFKNFKLNLPFNFNSVNIDTNIPLSPKVNESQQTFPDINLKQFLMPKNISSNDLGEAIKAMAMLIIKIFLVVISITSQMLRLVLEFLR